MIRASRRRGARRRRAVAPWILVGLSIAVVGIAAVALASSLASGGGRHERRAQKVGRTPAPPTRRFVGALRGLPVVTTQVPLVDDTRQVVRDGTVLGPRSLPTYVWRPSGGGPFPLVVFVHGYDTGPLTYERFCSTLASSGYVVAAPSFPLEDPSDGFGLDRADLPNEAKDVSYVLSALMRSASSMSIDPSKIAVVGHSDGADVALMTAYEQGTVDQRVAAVVADAPDPIDRTVVQSSAPLLLIQGTADSVVPYSSSETVFRQVQAPVYYLSLLGADHLPPIEGDTLWTPTLDAATADFLDATVAGRGPGVLDLTPQLSALPVTGLQASTGG